MDSRPPEGAPFPTIRQWKSCSHCGAPNPPWASGCGQCRQPFPDAREAAAEEAAHIEYLLQQLPGWRQHGLLSESAHARLRSDYLHLQKEFGDICFSSKWACRMWRSLAWRPHLRLPRLLPSTPRCNLPLRVRRCSGRWTCPVSCPDSLPLPRLDCLSLLRLDCL